MKDGLAGRKWKLLVIEKIPSRGSERLRLIYSELGYFGAAFLGEM